LTPPYPFDELEEVVDAKRPLWEELRGARVLITGGTGFFGRWLVESFAHADARLRLDARAVVLARHASALRKPAPHLASNRHIELFDADVRSSSGPEGAFSHVIHAATAASARLNEEQPLEMAGIIIDGTRRVLDLAARLGVRRFLFVSSGAVYGQQPADLPQLAEDYRGAPDPMSPRSAYGEAKRLAELYCASALSAVVARPFALVGPGLPLDRHFAIGNFIADGLAGRPICVKGDGTAIRSYLYASDLVIWLWTLLLQGRPGRAYNVGSEGAISIAHLAAAVGEQFRVPVEIQQASTPGRLPDRYVPSTRRAREELGLSESVSLPEAIRRTARWHASPQAGLRVEVSGR